MNIFLKHFFDRLFAIVFFILLSPLFILIAVAIKINDGGPVFFHQLRPGIDSKLFKIWKFRSMIVNADEFLNTKGQPIVGDRVTTVGKVLRRASFDELPQLLNIIRGEMSVVGPRPMSVEHLSKLTSEQRRRFAMRPGVTGLAQVNGRNTLKWSRRIDYDLDYIENFSLWLDFKILLKTVFVVFSQEGVVLDRNPEHVNDLDGNHVTKQRKKIA